MTAPSNANTSGLEVVAWAFRHGRDTRAVWLGPVRPEHWSDSEGHALVTAASAQARIGQLERWQAAAIRSARIHDENIREFDARATAAEARADRLAKALEPFALLAPSEVSNGVNMADPLSKWFTVAQFDRAASAIEALKSTAAKEGGE